jgi:DNA (cytosine-5)-methyltransferase 1
MNDNPLEMIVIDTPVDEVSQGLFSVSKNKKTIQKRENKQEFINKGRSTKKKLKVWSLDEVKKSASQKLFSVVSMFSGSGGSSTGYKMSGGDIRLVLDCQEIAIKSYLNNYPLTETICDDIRNITGKQILKRIGMKPKQLDILDGSPPCPPFSMAGSKREGWGQEKTVYGKKQKNIEDLTFDFIKVANEIQPKVIICENVKGLTMSYARDHFNKMINGFRECGYQTVFKVLNAVDYDVPQKRERVFIVSVRNDILENLGHHISGGMVFPDFTDRIFPNPNLYGYSQRDSIYDLLKDRENIKEGNELEEIMKTNKKYPFLKKLPKDPKVYQSVGDINPTGNFFQTRRIPWDDASNTILEKGLETKFFSHIHPEKDRGFTTYEAMRLMGLPEGFKLVGDLNERLSLVGLMVAPPQMHHLSKYIFENVIFNE